MTSSCEGSIVQYGCRISFTLILINCDIVKPYGVSGLGQHWFRPWLVAWSVPSYYQNQRWLIANCATGNKTSKIWIQIKSFSFIKMHLNMSPANYRQFCLGLNFLHIKTWRASRLLVLMMTSSNGDIFRVTGHLCGECNIHRWIPRTRASDAKLWCFLWWINGWVNNGEAGGLRRHCAPNDVTVMLLSLEAYKTYSDRKVCMACSFQSTDILNHDRWPYSFIQDALIIANRINQL